VAARLAPSAVTGGMTDSYPGSSNGTGARCRAPARMRIPGGVSVSWCIETKSASVPGGLLDARARGAFECASFTKGAPGAGPFRARGRTEGTCAHHVDDGSARWSQHDEKPGSCDAIRTSFVSVM